MKRSSSISPSAPYGSGLVSNSQNSNSTPPGSQHEELNIYKLMVSLLKLQKLDRYRSPSNEATVEHSLDGSVRVYLKRTRDAEDFKQEPSVTPKQPARECREVELLEQVFKRLSELAANQEDNSDSEPSQLKISLDNCTVVYFPKESDDEDLPQGEASLPGSLEGSTPKTRQYYNLSSPHTLRFIERAVRSTSPRQPSQPNEELVIESADHSILLIQPRSIAQPTKIAINLKMCTQNSSPGGLKSPLNLELLNCKLQALSIDESVAIGDENTRIILELSQSNSASESQSSNITSTPLIPTKAPDLMSPHTNRKLLRKLQAVQEDFEGEEDCLRDIDGLTRLYISHFSSSENSNPSSTSISASSPTLTQRLPPQHELLQERLKKYSKDYGNEVQRP